MPQRLLALLLCAALLISCCLPALAEDSEAQRFVAPTLPPDAIAWDKNHPEILDEDMLYAHSAILIEADSGEVLFEKNADEIMYPASTTKVLTGYIALQMADLDNDIVTVSQNAIDLVPPTYQTIPLSAGEQVPFAVIDEFVQSKAFWIITHLAEIEKIRNEISDASLYDGKTVYYLGKPYRLRLERGEQRITVAEDTILLSSPKLYSDVLKEEYLAWLKAQAEKKFAEIMDRIYPLVKEYHIARPEIKIRNMKSIWGSCTTTGSTIRLNLQLLKADEACIEQVVLHELLHFRYPNHGKSFYDLLGQLMPDWKVRKERLDKNFKDGI